MAEARAVVLTGERHLEVRALPLPDSAPEDGALLAVEASGICGSDHEFYTGGAVRSGYGEYPMVIGHEPVGRIAAIGPVAERRWGLAAGDRVAVEPYVPCGFCPACRAGTHRRCRDRFTYASVPITIGSGLWGGFAQYMELRPNTILHRVPDEMSVEDAVLFNPVGAGLDWVLNGGGVKPGDRVVILGAGQRALAAVAAASLVAAREILVTARRPGLNVDLARDFGASAAVLVGSDHAKNVETILGALSGPIDVVVDLVPRDPATVSLAVDLVRPGGRVVLAGIKGPGVVSEVICDRVILREVELVGVLGVSSPAFEQAIALVASARFPFERLHTATLGLDDVEKAILAIGGETPGSRPIHLTVVPI